MDIIISEEGMVLVIEVLQHFNYLKWGVSERQGYQLSSAFLTCIDFVVVHE